MMTMETLRKIEELAKKTYKKNKGVFFVGKIEGGVLKMLEGEKEKEDEEKPEEKTE